MTDLLTTAGVAARLACSVPTVLRMARSGELPHVQKLPGEKGAYLFDAAVVDELARRRLAPYRKAIGEKPYVLTTG